MTRKKIIILIVLVVVVIAGGVYLYQIFTPHEVINTSDLVTSSDYSERISFAEYKQINFPDFSLIFVKKVKSPSDLTAYFFIASTTEEQAPVVIKGGDSPIQMPSIISGADLTIGGKDYRLDFQGYERFSVWPVEKTIFSLLPEGVYKFSEFAAGDHGSNQTWTYQLAVVGENRNPKISLSVDGFQTLTRINALANEVDGSVDIIFDSYGPDSLSSAFRKGDVLFTLTPMPTGLSIEWKKMEPVLPQNLKGRVFTK